MSTTDICFMTATELARRIRTRELSARAVMEAHLTQIERVNPTVNALVTLLPERALAGACAADEAVAHGAAVGPLHGLPIAHKDLILTKGIRTTYGSRIYTDFVPDQDMLIVERMRAAGAITIGKTNTPEFGAGSQTFNEVFGATLNPYDLTKTCGGSSGGAAVALACGMVPLADGSDLGGSLRNPANFCNVVGFRTAPGRVPVYPVRDVWSPFSVEVGRDCRGVRIAWNRDFGGVPVDPRVTAAIDAQRHVFTALGCIIEDGSPDFSDADDIFKTWRAWRFELRYGELLHTHRHLMKDTVIWNTEAGQHITGPQLACIESKRTELYHRVREFMETYEFMICPVNQVPPFDVQQRYITEINGVKLETYIDWMRSCYFITVTGLPAISVPCGFTPEGLPVGVQIVGRHQDELGVLQLAYAFEQATQCWQQRPPVAA